MNKFSIDTRSHAEFTDMRNCNLLLHMQQKVAKGSTRDGRAVLREMLGEYAGSSTPQCPVYFGPATFKVHP